MRPSHQWVKSWLGFIINPPSSTCSYERWCYSGPPRWPTATACFFSLLSTSVLAEKLDLLTWSANNLRANLQNISWKVSFWELAPTCASHLNVGPPLLDLQPKQVVKVHFEKDKSAHVFSRTEPIFWGEWYLDSAIVVLNCFRKCFKSLQFEHFVWPDARCDCKVIAWRDKPKNSKTIPKHRLWNQQTPTLIMAGTMISASSLSHFRWSIWVVERWTSTATDRLFHLFLGCQTHAVQRDGLFS